MAHGHDHTIRYINHALGIIGVVAAFMLRDRPHAQPQASLQLAA
jgi:hypothetical protein